MEQFISNNWGYIGLGILGIGAAAKLANLITGSQGEEFHPTSHADLFGNQSIVVVSTEDQCQAAVEQLLRECGSNKVLGFDCEENYGGEPVHLLQLSSPSGHCYLFRLCKMKRRELPQSLKSLLENDRIIKVGVGSLNDARKLQRDFQIRVKGTLDLRFLAEMAGRDPRSLAHLAKDILNVDLNKSVFYTWNLPDPLDSEQVNYAALDVAVSIKIFNVLMSALLERDTRNFERVWMFCSSKFDRFFNYPIH